MKTEHERQLVLTCLEDGR